MTSLRVALRMDSSPSSILASANDYARNNKNFSLLDNEIKKLGIDENYFK